MKQTVELLTIGVLAVLCVLGVWQAFDATVWLARRGWEAPVEQTIAPEQQFYTGAYAMCRVWAQAVLGAPADEAVTRCNTINQSGYEKGFHADARWTDGFQMPVATPDP